MIWFLYILAFVMVAGGSFLVLDTDRSRDFLQQVMDDASYRLWGITAILIGVLIIISSFWSSVTWFLFLLGLLGVGKGVFLLLAEETVIANLADAWRGISDRGLRLWGLITVITGIAILAWT